MSNSTNSVTLVGRPGNNPIIKEFNNGKMARFSIAVNDQRYVNNQTLTETYWHNVVAWGKTAEAVQEVVKKGVKIQLEGKLVSRTWNDKSGLKHYITEIVLNTVELYGNADNSMN